MTVTTRLNSHLNDRAKRWLSNKDAGHMTTGLLLERDHEGEVSSWPEAIGVSPDDVEFVVATGPSIIP